MIADRTNALDRDAYSQTEQRQWACTWLQSAGEPFSCVSCPPGCGRRAGPWTISASHPTRLSSAAHPDSGAGPSVFWKRWAAGGWALSFLVTSAQGTYSLPDKRERANTGLRRFQEPYSG